MSRMRRLIQLAATAAVVFLIGAWPASAGGPVKAVNFDFKPKRMSVSRGDRVTWKNVEGRHTVTARRGRFDKVISGNERVSRRFKKSGTWRYICRFHVDQGMKGKVIVR
jgi:plastocyanin